MELYALFMHKLIAMQYALNSYISSTIRGLNDESSMSTSLLILGIAFTYGMVHAIGPGHGKALAALYFTSNKSSYKKAFKMGYLISVIHSISALIVTFGIFFTIKHMFRSHFDDLSNIAMQISAGMIMVVGLYLMYEAYKERDIKEKSLQKSNRSELSVALSAGVVPCPGVMTIVLFNIVLGHYMLGIAAAVAMSIGMGLTISLAGIFSIVLNNKVGSILDTKAYMLEIIGALLIFMLGLFLFIGSFNAKGF